MQPALKIGSLYKTPCYLIVFPSLELAMAPLTKPNDNDAWYNVVVDGTLSAMAQSCTVQAVESKVDNLTKALGSKVHFCLPEDTLMLMDFRGLYTSNNSYPCHKYVRFLFPNFEGWIKNTPLITLFAPLSEVQ